MEALLTYFSTIGVPVDFGALIRPDLIGSALVISFAICIFLLSVAAIGWLQRANNPVRRRARLVSGADVAGPGSSFGRQLADNLAPVKEYVLPKSQWEKDKAQARLVHAGFRSDQALTVFFFCKILLGVVLVALVLVGMPLAEAAVDREEPFTTTHYVFGLLGAAVVGLLLPNVILDRLVLRRQTRIRKAFPDALDLMVVCVEAGMGFAAAIDRVGSEIGPSHPELADELSLVNAEMRAGQDRAVAIRNLADRTGVEDIGIFAGLVTQTLKFGNSIADTLRVFAEDFRDKRIQRAEEQAAKIGAKLMLPLVFCLLPATFIVLVGPAGIQLVKIFSRV